MKKAEKKDFLPTLKNMGQIVAVKTPVAFRKNNKINAFAHVSYEMALICICIFGNHAFCQTNLLQTKQLSDGSRIKIFRESAPCDIPYVAPRAWTNTDGSVSRMVLDTSAYRTNYFNVVTEKNGVAETNGAIIQILEPSRRDSFYLVTENTRLNNTKKKIQWSEVQAVSMPPKGIIDFCIESNTAIYLCKNYFSVKLTGQPSLHVLIVTSPTNKNMMPSLVDHLIWHGVAGINSKLKSARITGSYLDGTLAIEMTSILGKNIITSTNNFIDGNWVVSQSKSVPLEKKE